jgi:hypothetical protein
MKPLTDKGSNGTIILNLIFEKSGVMFPLNTHDSGQGPMSEFSTKTLCHEGTYIQMSTNSTKVLKTQSVSHLHADKCELLLCPFCVTSCVVSDSWPNSLLISRYSDWLRAGRRRVRLRVPVGSRIFSSPRRPDRLWGPPSLLSNGYRGLLAGNKAAGV